MTLPLKVGRENIWAWDWISGSIHSRSPKALCQGQGQPPQRLLAPISLSSGSTPWVICSQSVRFRQRDPVLSAFGIQSWTLLIYTAEVKWAKLTKSETAPGTFAGTIEEELLDSTWGCKTGKMGAWEFLPILENQPKKEAGPAKSTGSREHL